MPLSQCPSVLLGPGAWAKLFFCLLLYLSNLYLYLYLYLYVLILELSLIHI